MVQEGASSPSRRSCPALDRSKLGDPGVAIDLFRRGERANLDTPGRRGGTDHLPARGRLVMTGDLHDHGPNLSRLVKLARLHRGADHHLVLHELIHGPYRVNGLDLSVRTLACVAALKVEYPGQVHLLLANHELAQLGGDEILKDGVSVVGTFEQGMDFIYADDAPGVKAAMERFIRSMPLAVRCPHGIMCSHSLPSPRMLRSFDTTVIDRVPTDQDLAPGGSAYSMVWGRNHNDELADALARSWDARLFLLGHQPAEMGYDTEGRSILIMASDHSHGMALPLDLARPYQRDELIERLVPLASITT